MKELTYSEVAGILGFSLAQTKRIMLAHRRAVKPIRYGYRTVRFASPQVAALKRKLRANAIRRGQSISKAV